MSDSLNVKKQRVHFYGTVFTIKRHKNPFYGPFYGYKFSIRNFVLINTPIFGDIFQIISKLSGNAKMQPNLRVPTVLSTCKMEKSFLDSLRVKNFNIHSFQKNKHNARISFIRDGTAFYGLVEQFYSARDVNYAIISTFKVLKTEKPEDVSLKIFFYFVVELSGKQSDCSASQIFGKTVKILYNSKTFLIPLLDVFEHD